MKKIVGAKLRELRKERQCSQEEVVNSLGVSQATYSRLENGQAKITYEIICKLIQLYKLKSEDLIDIFPFGTFLLLGI
ncbi:helix-turn-helix domain-containing protein [Runella sp.]|uniref:helix-turn-helix domain-containing protein n=1 Tax=Runella sp. TaxID=1960881 RepID=UPI003D10E897